MANAATININTGTSDALRNALASAANGDVIVMAAGTYEESNSNYIAFNAKNVTVKAADGATVIIKPHVPFTISGGARAEIIGVKIDASELCTSGSYSHLMYASDNADNNRLILDGCEVYGYAEGKAVIACRSSYKLDSLIINNCKFYNHTTRSCVFLENTANKGLIVTNSTFNNITTGTADFSAGVVDSRSASGKVQVDHCTFYNCYAKTTDYGAIKVPTTTDSHVSNCIFMMSESYSGGRAVYNTGGTVDNCLTYNYTKDSAPCHGIHSGPTITNCFEGDPLFSNAASGNFTIANNWTTMSLSPACCAATDGSDLGDPRWSNPTLPSTNFASPYVFLGTKALLSGSFALNGDNYIQSQNKAYDGVAVWKIHAERRSIIQVTLNIAAGNTSGHKYKVELFDSDNAIVGEALAEPADSWSAGDLVLSGLLEFPKAGDYKVKLSNQTNYSSTIIEGVTFTYIGGAVQNMPGTTNIADAWFSSGGTRADGKIDFPDGYIQDGWVKWNVAFASAVKCNVTVNIDNVNGHNYTVALYRNESDESPITLSEGMQMGTIGTLDLGAMEVPAGNYIMKVTNAIQYSDAKLISVTFAYAGGAAQNIPCAITLSDAILSSRAYIEEGNLHFTDADHLSTISGEWAKWNIHAASEGVYTFTAHCSSTNHSNLTIKVLDTDENELYSYTPEYTYNQADKEITSPEWILTAGDYILKLSNPANHSNGYLLSLAAAKGDIIVLDENATDYSVINANDGVNTKKIALKRSFKAGMYNTICLPFSDWVSSLELVFGTGYELWELNTAELDGDVLNLDFTQVTGEFGHGRPYLIKPSKDVTNPIFGTGHTMNKSTSYNIKNGTNANFVGSFIKYTIPAGEDNLFLGANDKLYFSNEATVSKGMRAYFQIHDVPAGVIQRARIVQQGEVVTELELIDGEWVDARINANGLIKTIENGQLVIIKDGAYYNAFGVKVK